MACGKGETSGMLSNDQINAIISRLLELQGEGIKKTSSDYNMLRRNDVLEINVEGGLYNGKKSPVIT